jgi:tRNA-dihydrouridine synthase
MGKPWIAEDIIRRLKGEPPLERGIPFIRSTLLEHFESIVRYQNERQSLLDFRRVGCWYLKPCIGAKPLRMQLNQAETTSEVFRLLEAFPWDTLSLSQEPQVLEV